LEHEGEPTALVEMWAGRRLVVIVDAMAGSEAPGTLRWFDATTAPLPSAFSGASTHAFSLPQAIELSRALGGLPERLFVLAIEGSEFRAGPEPDPAVARAAEQAADTLVRFIGENY
jgi:hydrogenase maturation protease